MRKIKYTVLLGILLANLAIGQDTLVKNNGDTLQGRVTFGTDPQNREFIIVKSGRKKERLNIFEVKSVETSKEETIVPVSYGGLVKMGKVIVSGYMSYYMVSNSEKTEQFTSHLLQKADGTFSLYEGKLAFKAKTRRFVQNCQDLVNDLNEKKYRIKDLAELTKAYNACIDAKTTQAETAAVTQPVASKEKEKKEEPVSESLEKKLSDFFTLLEYSDQITNKTDVKAMFNDVSTKLKNKESIPDYLKNALLSALKPDQKLTKLIREILQNQ